MKKCLFFLVSSLLLGGITSCSCSEPSIQDENKNFIVIFETNGGVLEVESMEINPNEFVELPVPTKENYIFDGWYIDKELTKPFDINDKYEGTITVYASWKIANLIQISNKEEFKNIELDKNYELVANIDFQGEEITPIGNEKNPFRGIFNGNGYTISNFKIKNDSNYALFSYITGEINNLTIDAQLTINVEKASYISLLAAHTYNAKIDNCYVKGSINITSTSEKEPIIVGGLVGYNEASEIKNSISSVSIKINSLASAFAGGLVGYNGGGKVFDSKIYSSYAKNSSINVSVTNIRASSYAGGVVGYNFGLIDKCFSHNQEIVARVNDYYGFAAGVVADNNGGRVSNCFGASNVSVISESGNTFRGRVIGRNFKAVDEEGSGTFFNCYGLSAINCSYSVNSKYSKLTSHEQVNTEIVYLKDIKDASRYKNVLDFEDFNIKNEYFPSLNSEFKKISYNPSEGSIENPILIENESDLASIDVKKSYRLKNDITLTSSFKPIGDYFEPYCGVFDGNGYSIKNLKMDSTTNSLYNGFFGYVNGIIKNLKVEYTLTFDSDNSNNQFIGAIAGFTLKSIISSCSSNIQFNTTSMGQTAGGLVGYLDQTELYNSYSVGLMNVKSKTRGAYFGGLVGVSYHSLIHDAYSKVNIEGDCDETCYIGGVLGKNEGEIDSTYALNNLKVKNASSQYVGGLVGYNKYGSVKNSYAKSIFNYDSTGEKQLIGGLIGLNSTDLVNCYYNSSENIKYSCGHSPVFVEVKRVNNEELKSLASSLGNSFYDGEDSIPHLNFEKEAK